MANSKISVENLNLHYGENHALKDVNMEIADHAITAFIGPSGCGKSTGRILAGRELGRKNLRSMSVGSEILCFILT